MRLGKRARLFVLFTSIALLIGLASGVWAVNAVERWGEDRVETELLRHARAARVFLGAGTERPAGPSSMDTGAESAPCPIATGTALANLTDRLGRELAARVTIIAADGRVLADSSLTPDALARAENRSQRPEVKAALAGREGASKRPSATLGEALLYAAVPLVLGQDRGVVRVSLSLSSVEETTQRLRVVLILTGSATLLAVILLVALVSRIESRGLRALIASVQAMAREGAAGRVQETTSDELGWLAGSFHVLSEELEQTVETLVSERDRFGAVLEGMREAVLAISHDGRITLANRAALVLFGLAPSSIGRTFAECIPIPEFMDLATRAQQGQPATVEGDLPGPPRRRALAQATPLRAGRGGVIVMHDVTELRHLETVRRDFVANVSHELRTPISIIRANAETLIDGALEDRDRAMAFTEAILRHTERLSRLVADLLDISSIEAGRYPIHPEHLSLADVIHRVFEGVASLAHEKRLALTQEVAPEIAVLADAKALEQVLLNLVDNAVKYTHDGGRVIVRTHPEGDQVRIEVEDNGPGVAPTHRTRIFERFYRVDPGRSREVGGTGLGLAIVKHLVAAMNGAVGMEPREGGGAVFWVHLPRDENRTET